MSWAASGAFGSCAKAVFAPIAKHKLTMVITDLYMFALRFEGVDNAESLSRENA